eukprot:jgi/Tetstr1/454167/TSEL_041086.t1
MGDTGSAPPAAADAGFGMNTLPVHVIFFLTLNLLSNFSGELLSCELQTLFDTNIYAKHLLGLMLIVFFNTLTDPVSAENIGRTVGEAFLVYLWFVMLSRNHIVSVLCIAAVVFTIYVLDVRIKRLARAREKNGDDDGSKQRETSALSRTILVLKWTALALTIAGMIVYLFMKRKEYGPEFNLVRFVLGTAECRRSDKPIRASRT